MVRVDIIIPTYNRATVLPDTLQSVQAQTFPDWRCFIAEDGETPETKSAAALFLQDSRFTYLPGAHSGCPATCRNRGIRAGTAPFIAFLDDDDIWLPSKLEEQLHFMVQHPKCVLVGSNAYNWDGQRRLGEALPLYFQHPAEGQVAFESLAADNGIINSTAVVRRDALLHSGLLNESPALASCEDYELWLRIAALGEVWRMAAALAVYRNMPQAGIRAGMTLQAHYLTLARVYAAALRGDGETPSPLKHACNKDKACVCRNMADFYRCKAGSFLEWRRPYARIAAAARNALLKTQVRRS